MKSKLITVMSLALLCAPAAYADVDISPAAAQSASQDGARKIGEAFLAANKTKPGVVTLADGLQYKILTSGQGPKPSDQDVVTVEYEGKLINGTVFDSSAKHGGTIDFQVGQVIPGWVEALKLMQAGGTWELYIPSDLAYGENGAPPAIGPKESLVFKVKLVSFKKSA
jgi:FKBP-type peptidyl-prolyl cis-trans isomerase FklB